MSPMNPRLMRPIASRATLPPYAPVAYTRLWAVTTQATGDIEGEAESDTGYYAVKWWDNSVDVYDSGDPFSKAAAGNPRVFEVYPSNVNGVPSGDFEGFDVSGNDLTQLRADNVTLANSGGAQTGGYFYQGYWWSGWLSGPYFSPAIFQNGKLENNLLTAEALDQFYTDLDNGTGSLFVAGNPGIDADDPTIATAKGYTVFGSVPPGTALLLNFNGTNGSTTFTDSSPNGLTVTANGDAEISTAQSKFGGSSVYFDGSGDYLSATLPGGLGPGDFTIEGWFYFSSFYNYITTVSTTRSSTGFSIGSDADAKAVWFTDGLARVLETDANVLSVNTWHHIAYVRQSGTVKVFVDGVEEGSAAFSSDMSQESLFIGNLDGNGEDFTGYIDDLRIVKDIALYTANFTPPAAQLGVYP